MIGNIALQKMQAHDGHGCTKITMGGVVFIVVLRGHCDRLSPLKNARSLKKFPYRMADIY